MQGEVQAFNDNKAGWIGCSSKSRDKYLSVYNDIEDEYQATLRKRQSSSYKQWLISSCSVKNRGVVVVVSWCRGVEFCVWCLLSAVYACFQLGLIWFGSDFRFNRELFRKISSHESLRDS